MLSYQTPQFQIALNYLRASMLENNCERKLEKVLCRLYSERLDRFRLWRNLLKEERDSQNTLNNIITNRILLRLVVLHGPRIVKFLELNPGFQFEASREKWSRLSPCFKIFLNGGNLQSSSYVVTTPTYLNYKPDLVGLEKYSEYSEHLGLFTWGICIKQMHDISAARSRFLNWKIQSFHEMLKQQYQIDAVRHLMLNKIADLFLKQDL